VLVFLVVSLEDQPHSSKLHVILTFHKPLRLLSDQLLVALLQELTDVVPLLYSDVVCLKLDFQTLETRALLRLLWGQLRLMLVDGVPFAIGHVET